MMSCLHNFTEKKKKLFLTTTSWKASQLLSRRKVDSEGQCRLDRPHDETLGRYLLSLWLRQAKDKSRKEDNQANNKEED